MGEGQEMRRMGVKGGIRSRVSVCLCQRRQCESQEFSGSLEVDVHIDAVKSLVTLWRFRISVETSFLGGLRYPRGGVVLSPFLSLFLSC